MTELLSNVHRHARPDKSCTVELELAPDRLTVSVRDHDPRLPVLADDAAHVLEAAPLATCGRGLAMVAAVSESWGARPDGENGKVVWFTLSAPAVARPHPAHTPRRTREPLPTPEPVPVRSTVPVAASAPVPAAASVPATAVPAGTPVRTGAPVGAAAQVTSVAPAPAVAGVKAPARSAVPG
ncbi:hypothetical protein M878_40020 [Streptomyces roseochromogenus subsp. oscitans DS 12.976]|uniref:Histidine kinase/HSP90-like ATPase domain-containing protein n=1 Tax=Streptomyces roseochromogenus subsp. oscitans DS 12.976 TaxID=1352936 RepID=V6JKI0_STRRC|nr:hypothetical protein M878_40020 [Streptomyces roseochromogenus subsp. oscitans DS 12.976]